MIHRFLTCCFVSALLGAPVHAKDTALVLSNMDYRYGTSISDVLDVASLVRQLKRDGYTVFSGEDARVSGMLNLARSAKATVASGDRLVVVMQGHFANYHNSAYLLGTRARAPDQFDLGTQGLSVDAILDLLSDHQGKALLVLTGPENGLRTDDGVAVGLPKFVPPQGVTVISGIGRSFVQAVEDVFSGEALNTIDGVTGFSPAVAFAGADSDGISAPDQLTEDDYWQVVRGIDSVKAYESYLKEYPSGAQRAAAQDAIEFIEDAPLRDAKLAETELRLSRDDRRNVQANLTILGFDTRGVDGVFGRGSRGAIAKWQAREGYAETGYLTGNQVLLIEEQGATRQAEIAEEERLAEADRLEKDRDYWWDTGRGRTADGLKKYLNRYPDGEYADQARRQLQKLEPAKDQVTAQQVETDKAQEAQIAKNPITRLLIEKGLDRLGLKPGRVDARFDQDTRNAVRSFQKSVGLAQTGYVGQSTVVKLLNNQ